MIALAASFWVLLVSCLSYVFVKGLEEAIDDDAWKQASEDDPWFK